jgi:hypothetical protein
MMTTLAQFDLDRWGDIIAVLVIVLIPLLGSLGKVLRKRSGPEEGADEEDETLGEEIILLPPRETRRPAPPARPLPPRGREPPLHRRLDRPLASPPLRPRPARPVPPAPPARPVAPLVRPTVPRGVARVPPSARPERRPPELSRKPIALEPIEQAALADIHGAVAHLRAGARPTIPKGIAFLGRLDRDELRKAIILSELLRPPLALRSPGTELWDA